MTDDDRSRHEEAVAKYLFEVNDAEDNRRMALLRTSDKLLLWVGRAYSISKASFARGDTAAAAHWIRQCQIITNMAEVQTKIEEE